MYMNAKKVKNKASPIEDENPFESGDLLYGLSFPRMEFMSLNKILLERAQGTTIDSFAATETEHKFIREHDGGQYPAKQESYERALLSHPKYSHIRTEMGFIIDRIVYDDPLWIRRKCKAGLYWASKEGISVHFVLDNIDMSRVVLKKDKSFTSSELRWLFRHRHESGVKQAIKYFKGGEYIPAPWDAGDSVELWKGYTPNQSS